MTDVRKIFAENLRDLRLMRDISQETLARRCGLHRTEVSLLERAGREPRLSTIAILAASLDVGLDRLCKDIDGAALATDKRREQRAAQRRVDQL